MKILFLTTHFNTGGITSYVLTLTKGFVRQGHEVFIVSGGGDKVNESKRLGAEHVTMNIRTKSVLSPKLFLAAPKVRELIRKNGLEIVHAQTRVTQFLAYLACGKDRKFVSTCHGYFRPRCFRRMFPFWGNRVIAISEQVEKHLLDDFHVPEQCVYRIVHGIDTEQFSRANDNQILRYRKQFNLTTEHVLGHIGRLSDVKGQDILIQAMPKIVRRYPNVRLLIFGEGKMKEELEDLVKDLNLQNHVLIISIMTKTFQLYSLFDIFVMPSRMEGLGLSVLEAQASGCCVVASDVGGLRTLIENGVNGILVPPEDANALAEAIIHLLDHLNEAKAIGCRAREIVQKEYHMDRMIEETLRVYRDSLEAK